MSGKEIEIILLVIYLGGAAISGVAISGVWALLTWIYRSYSAESSTGNIRNILIVGRTGSGKSTLANVLLGKEKFTEVGGSISGTKIIQKEFFEFEGNRYCVIDTIGTGETSGLSDKEIFNNIYKSIEGNGIKQAFFVYKGRFTKEQIEAFKWYKRPFLFKYMSNLTSYLTIVCTNFPEFEDKEKCEEDREKLLAENKDIAEIIREFNIIHVNNPPPGYGDMAGKARESSRQKLLNHLKCL
nr:6489_t:CDS:1 [Entrophospora candida]CAG8585898.1 12023_t:CDS:1 [Entrophospora candida]